MLQKCSGRANTLPNASPTNLTGRVEEAGRDAVRRQSQDMPEPLSSRRILHVYGSVAVPLLLVEPRQCLLELPAAICLALADRIVVSLHTGRQHAVPISAVSSHDEKLLCYLMMHTIHANCLVCDCVQYSLARTYSARWTDAKSRPATEVDQPRRVTSPLDSKTTKFMASWQHHYVDGAAQRA